MPRDGGGPAASVIGARGVQHHSAKCKVSEHPVNMKEATMSNLVEKLKEVDLGDGCLSDEEADYLECHVVQDMPPNFSAAKIVFLVESPHRDEIKYGHPLAGHSGRNVTKDLIFSIDARLRKGLSEADKQLPIGELITENKVRWLAVMNVSLLPLQKSAYKDHAEEHSEKMQTLWRSFCEIRKEIANRVSRDVYAVMVDDLACRIERIVDRRHQLRFIPFGNVARCALQRVQQAQENGPLQGLSVSKVRVWHPSTWRYDGKPNEEYISRDSHLRRVASDIMRHL